MLAGNVPCASLEWDTTFWEFPVARVIGHSINEEDVPGIDEWCHANRVRCLYLLARMDDPGTVLSAERHGFHLTDVRIDFALEIEGARTASGDPATMAAFVRPFRSDDGEALKAIARQSYHDTRFYFDRQFPRERCHLLYETWIRRSWEGYADAVLVAERNAGAVGFVTCHVDRGDAGPIGRIGLIGVADYARGLGVGQMLTSAAVRWFAEQGVRSVLVATQARNIAAQRLYQRCGFTTHSVHLWYHKWYAEGEAVE